MFERWLSRIYPIW
jgi:WD40 repeat protein